MSTKLDQLTSWLKERKITEVECLISDLTGIARGKISPTNKFLDEKGMRLPESVLLQTVTGELPLGVGPPQLSPLTSSTMDLLKIGLVSDRLDPFQLRDTAEWIMKPALLAVPGVAHVLVFGGAEREIDIQPDLRRMTSYGFTLTDLADAARQASRLGLEVHGGHGLDYRNVVRIAEIPEIVELNIGHSIVARAVMVGMEQAVREMKALLTKVRS